MGIKFFKKEAPINGGNTLDTKQTLNAQRDIDYANLEKVNANISRSMKSVLTDKTKEYINSKLIQPYYLLQMHANYFCNTIDFECKTPYLKDAVLKVIRASFLFGRAGMFYDEKTNRIFPVAFISGKVDIYGNFNKIMLAPIDSYLSSQTQKPSIERWIEIEGTECTNYVEFKWGTLGISAWITIWPFIQYQYMILQMMVGLSFSYSKKYVYNVVNPLAIKDEMDLYFDPTNFFLVNAGFSGDLSNKFKVIDSNGKTDTTDFLDYYNGVMNTIYSIIGRRVNIDAKKERNVMSEVMSTQENYDILKREYMNQFKIFMEKFNNLPIIAENDASKIELIEYREIGNMDDI